MGVPSCVVDAKQPTQVISGLETAASNGLEQQCGERKVGDQQLDAELVIDGDTEEGTSE